MQHLTTWAQRWNIPPEALRELVTPADDPDVLPGTSEAAIQTQLRVKASQAGVGVCGATTSGLAR